MKIGIVLKTAHSAECSVSRLDKALPDVFDDKAFVLPGLVLTVDAVVQIVTSPAHFFGILTGDTDDSDGITLLARANAKVNDDLTHTKMLNGVEKTVIQFFPGQRCFCSQDFIIFY